MKTVYDPSYGILYPIKKNDRFTLFLDIKFGVYTENGQENIVEALALANMYLPNYMKDTELSQEQKQFTLSAIFHKRFIDSYNEEIWKMT